MFSYNPFSRVYSSLIVQNNAVQAVKLISMVFSGMAWRPRPQVSHMLTDAAPAGSPVPIKTG